MGTKVTYPGFHSVTRDNGIFEERVHDSYKISGKLAEPTLCPLCKAVFHQGRWQWLTAPENAHRHNCPACQRIKDHFPAGFLTLEGDFFRTHRTEIMNLVRHFEEKEKKEHPLKRIISSGDSENGVQIATTDIHLARGMGEAVHHAYQGDLEFHYNQAENLLRVHWFH